MIVYGDNGRRNMKLLRWSRKLVAKKNDGSTKRYPESCVMPSARTNDAMTLAFRGFPSA